MDAHLLSSHLIENQSKKRESNVRNQSNDLTFFSDRKTLKKW